MLTDGILMRDGSTLENVAIESLGTLPVINLFEGRIFYKTTTDGFGVEGLYIYKNGAWEPISNTFDQTAADLLYVELTGDTMTGFLTLDADPINPLHAATKQYVDTTSGFSQTAADLLYVELTGDIMTGFLTLDADPINPLHAATKQYIDTQILGTFDQTAADLLYVKLSGDIMTGTLTLNADPTLALEAATMQYVDTQVALVQPQVAILTGTISHGGTIPLPSGYTQAQCKWMVSMANPDETNWGANQGGGGTLQYFTVYANTSRVVTCKVEMAGYSPTNQYEEANYIIVGVK